MSYKKLEIYHLAREISIQIHKMSRDKLPSFEMYEEGSQIRRSSKSTRHNIVEGYGRRRFMNEYAKFLTYSAASNDETRDHLETLMETGSLTDKDLYMELMSKINRLGAMLNSYLLSIIQNQHE